MDPSDISQSPKTSACTFRRPRRRLSPAAFLMSGIFFLVTLITAALPVAAQQDQPAEPVELIPLETNSDQSLKLEVSNAIRKGALWLLRNQEKEGHWSDMDHPALTSFALFALLNDPLKTADRDQFEGAVDRGFDYILGKVKPDGGVYTEGVGLANYNTSLSIMALTAAGNPDYAGIIRDARKFVIGGQFDFGEKGVQDTPLDGGIGYGNSYPHSDMSNTVMALEAIRYSEAYRGEESIPGVNDLNWEAAIQFISNCQNLKVANEGNWVSEDKANKGGFVYFPGNTKSDMVELPDGRVALRSYGSISYAGLLSFAYAKLEPDDERVVAVLKWLSDNYTLEENPGMNHQGLFYYFHTMSKALTAAGLQTLEVSDRGLVNWRKDLALKLMDLQKQDGSWTNETARWWEKDPVLVTSYCLIALELIERSL